MAVKESTIVSQEHSMRKSDQDSAREAILCCRKLAQWLTPVLRDTRARNLDGVEFLARMIADLGALRGSLEDMLRENEAIAKKKSARSKPF